MSGYWNGTEWVETVSDPWNPNQPTPSASTKETEVNIEDPNMWEQVSKYIANKLTTASDLAKRVAELEARIDNLRFDLDTTKAELTSERNNHAHTAQVLAEVRSQLAQRESTVHDLVAERDSVRDELARTQQERDTARRESVDWQELYNGATKERDDARHHGHVLDERCNLLTQRVAAFKAAFSGLSDL